MLLTTKLSHSAVHHSETCLSCGTIYIDSCAKIIIICMFRILQFKFDCAYTMKAREAEECHALTELKLEWDVIFYIDISVFSNIYKIPL